MSKKHILSALAGGALMIAGFAGTAQARPDSRAEASIPFVSFGSIRDWRAVDRDTLYIQDVHRNWYRAELLTSCHDLNFAHAIGFDARGTDRFDKFSSVVVRGQRCPVRSLVASAPPPKKDRTRKS